MNTITEDYVSIETAKLLKEKGFPQNPYICNTAYTLRGKLSNNAKSFVHNFAEFNKCGIKPITYSMAPTLQMAMKWLREVHDIFIQLCIISSTTVTMDQNYYFVRIYIGRREKRIPELYEKYFKTPEQAAEAAIKYCLENLI